MCLLLKYLKNTKSVIIKVIITHSYILISSSKYVSDFAFNMIKVDYGPFNLVSKIILGSNFIILLQHNVELFILQVVNCMQI